MVADPQDVRLGFRFDARNEGGVGGVLTAAELEVL